MALARIGRFRTLAHFLRLQRGSDDGSSVSARDGFFDSRKEQNMVVNQQTLAGNWNQIKGQLRKRWGDLSGDELESVHGNVEQLVGTIQRRTGEARETVEEFLEELTGSESSTQERAEKVGQKARHYAHAAQESIQETAQQAAANVRAGYARTEETVQRRPMESLAVCFGVGLIAGAILGMMVRSR